MSEDAVDKYVDVFPETPRHTSLKMKVPVIEGIVTCEVADLALAGLTECRKEILRCIGMAAQMPSEFDLESDQFKALTQQLVVLGAAAGISMKTEAEGFAYLARTAGWGQKRKAVEAPVELPPGVAELLKEK